MFSALMVAVALSGGVPPGDTVKHKAPPLLTRRQVVIGVAAIAATVAARPLDQRLNGELQSPEYQDEPGLHRTANDLAFMGGPGPFVIGGSLLAVGAATRNNSIISASVRLTESVALSAGITAVAKGISGRALPGVKTKHSFSFGRGFQDDNGPFVSFPSGHTAAAFAMATSLSKDVDQYEPALAPYVRPLTFALATGVAVSRLYNHVHWLSDLPLGAAIGMWSASTIHARAAAKAGAARKSLVEGMVLTPIRGGLAISWSSR